MKQIITAYVFVLSAFFLSSCTGHQHPKAESIGQAVSTVEMGHYLNLNRQQYRKVHLDLSAEQRKKVEALIGSPLTTDVLHYSVLEKKRGKGVHGIFFSVEEGDEKAVIILRKEGRISHIISFSDGELQKEESLQHLSGHTFASIQRDIQQKRFQHLSSETRMLIHKILIAMAILKVLHEE